MKLKKQHKQKSGKAFFGMLVQSAWGSEGAAASAASCAAL